MGDHHQEDDAMPVKPIPGGYTSVTLYLFVEDDA